MRIGICPLMLCAAAARGQMAEEVFKNVQVLKGISVNEFMGTMGFFSASLSLNCTDCHNRRARANGRNMTDDTSLNQFHGRLLARGATERRD